MAATSDKAISSLAALSDAISGCRRCPLYRNATHAVPGEGRANAQLMLVGEQPGNEEDLAGRPFVGPAGRVLDKALREAGLDRRTVFITNAVKHFKFERRGKRRLHKRPNAEEIRICGVWNAWERKLIKPRLTIAMGATAARSVLGRTVKIGSSRGRILSSPEGDVLVTIHPSLILRIPDAAAKKLAFRDFVRDLKLPKTLLSAKKRPRPAD